MSEDTPILIEAKDLDLTTNMVIRPTKPKTTLEEIDSIQCGKESTKHFGFADGYRNLNHGSFGTFPAGVKAVQRQLQDSCESRPDWFIRYEFPKKNDEAREAVAKILGVGAEVRISSPQSY